jgi:hypothetical protein
VGEYAKTPEAHEHDLYMVRAIALIKWFLSKKPHMIFLLENPKGLLCHMPIIKNRLEKGYLPCTKVYHSEVHYCACGRDDKKPTDMWTNVSMNNASKGKNEILTFLYTYACFQDLDLSRELNSFRCSCSGSHAIGARGNCSRMNFAAFPDKLAEFVAQYADSKFFMNHIRDLPEPTISEQDKEEFHKMMRLDN